MQQCGMQGHHPLRFHPFTLTHSLSLLVKERKKETKKEEEEEESKKEAAENEHL